VKIIPRQTSDFSKHDPKSKGLGHDAHRQHDRTIVGEEPLSQAQADIGTTTRPRHHMTIPVPRHIRFLTRWPEELSFYKPNVCHKSLLVTGGIPFVNGIFQV
jgi:hypothetical protein